MCAIPARVAGRRRGSSSPRPPGAAGRPTAAVLAACAIAGVDEVYAIGGAQAIAALALGTETIAAGRRDRRARATATSPRPSGWLAGRVGIDGIAGPSELVVVADGDRRARELARARPLRPGRARRRRPAGRRSRPTPALLDRVARAASRRSPPSAPSVADAPLALVDAPGPRAGARARRRARARAPRARLRGRRRDAPRAAGSRAASSSAPAARPPSATTPPARTTCCRPAARRASAGRSARARSCAAPPSSRSRPAAAAALAPHGRRARRGRGLPGPRRVGDARAARGSKR